MDGQNYRSYAALIEYWLEHPYGNVEALPRGTGRVYLLCERYINPIAEGSHRVRMVGRLPDGTEVESDEINVTLSCEGASVDAGLQALGDAVQGDGGQRAGGLDGGQRDGSLVDGNASVGASVDGGQLPTMSDAGHADDDGDGCAVATPGSARAGRGLWLMVGVGLIAALRRRRLSKRSSGRASQK